MIWVKKRIGLRNYKKRVEHRIAEHRINEHKIIKWKTNNRDDQYIQNVIFEKTNEIDEFFASPKKI